MAASRLLSLLGPSILRTSHNSPPFRSSKIFFPKSLQFRRYCSAALKLDSDDNSVVATDDFSKGTIHPWPEWVKFVDRLQEKGYFSQKENEGSVAYTDMNVVKDACLSFGRHRFDIFNSLSSQEMQTVVGKGCPSLLRKVVNSAKRLRVYVGLVEGDVCGSCNLRDSCDRAYVMVNESEAAARTVDIVRILLLYALDPVVISGEDKGAGRELVEASVRKLLSELIEFSETVAPDPEISQPVVPSKKQSVRTFKKESSRGDDQMKPGDWTCAKCDFMNFARNITCKNCKAEGPKHAYAEGIERKKGDWNCPECSFMNFASKRECFRCRHPRPPRELKPGDWECPSCDFMNFSRNFACKKCNVERSRRSVAQNDEQSWKRPY